MSRNTILIIEDSMEDFAAAERALQKSAHLANEIHHCDTGEKALDYLFNRGNYSNRDEYPLPDIILLDLNLPMMDGKEVLEAIRSHREFNSIPIIVLTTSSNNQDVEECYALGANSYIHKPIDIEGLVQALSRFEEYWFKIVLLPNPKKGVP